MPASIRSMKMRALDNVGAYAGRSPFQLGKPIGAIVGPYRIESVQYRAHPVTTNKTVQEAVRGFGQSPTNYAIESAIDEVARPSRARPPRGAPAQLHPQRASFPYLIPSGTTYDSGDYHAVIDKVLAHGGLRRAGRASATACARSGLLAGIGIAACLEPSGANSSFEPLLNPKNTTTTWMDSCRIIVDGRGAVTVTIHTTLVRAGPRDAGRHGGRRGAGDRSRPDPRGAAGLAGVAAEPQPGRQPHGDHARRRRVPRGAEAEGEAGRDRGASISALPTRARDLRRRRRVRPRGAAEPAAAGSSSCTIAHRNFHRLPPGIEPGLAVTHVMQVPTGGTLPTADGRVQMYPCHLVRVPPGADGDRSRSRQARDQALRHRPRLRHRDQSADRAGA